MFGSIWGDFSLVYVKWDSTQCEIEPASDYLLLDIYRLPTKLWEGNVFTHVYLSVHRGPHVTITHGALDLTVQDPHPSGHQTWTPPPGH